VSVDADLLNAELSADAAWERVSQLERINEQLTTELGNHRKQSNRNYYGCQGFMAIKSEVDRYNAHIGTNSADEAIGKIYAHILEHKGRMDRADAK
jgi:hypothetical protein